MAHVLGGRSFGVDSAVTPRVMLFGHEEIDGAALGEQTDGLSLLCTLLSAGTVLLAMLAELNVAGKVDDFTDNANRFTRLRFAVHACGHGSGSPRLAGELANRGHGLIPGAVFHCKFGMKNGRLSWSLFGYVFDYVLLLLRRQGEHGQGCDVQCQNLAFQCLPPFARVS